MPAGQAMKPLLNGAGRSFAMFMGLPLQFGQMLPFPRAAQDAVSAQNHAAGRTFLSSTDFIR